jgi:hypothetical protein
MGGDETTDEESPAELILSFRRRKTGDKNHYLVNFEDAAASVLDADMVEQRRWSYNAIRLVDVLRGERNLSSLSTTTQARLNRLGRLLRVQDRPYRLPSMVRRQIDEYETVLLFCGQVYELRSLDGIDWQDTQTVIYTGDTWEPQLDRLSSLIDQYNIDVVICSYQKARDVLSVDHDSIYWLPQAIDPSTWRDYGLEKQYTCIQFGRKNPTLDEFARDHYPDNEYVDWYIPGFENLGRHINQSKFCLAAPRLLQSPEETGDISPVTVRYYQAMACKSMPAGFKPREFDDIFSDDIFFLEYETDEQFARELDYYDRNEDEYWEKVERNHELVMENHTWRARAEEMGEILQETR